MVTCINQTVENDALPAGNGDSEESQRLYEELSQVIDKVALPAVCVFGMVGNTLNLTILTRRKLQKSFRTLEQAANLCLISLAVSDLMFCVSAFLTMFFPAEDIYEEKGILLMYRFYHAAVINVFILASTWLTVAMSLERYLAICFPLRQDLYLTTRRIKYVIVFTFIFSVCFNIPVLWRYEAVTLCSLDAPSTAKSAGVTPPYNNSQNLRSDLLEPNGSLSYFHATQELAIDSESFTSNVDSSSSLPSSSHSSPAMSLLSSTPSSPVTPSPGSESGQTTNSAKYKVIQMNLWNSPVTDTAYRIIWALMGNFIPLGLLFYFNFCLCRKIYRSYKMRKQLGRQQKSTAKSSSHVLTITLVVIVAMFFILVAPSEIVMELTSMTNSNNTATYKSIEAILNFMQAINFSVNFILYCIISPYFRKTLKYLMLCGCYNIYQVSRQWKKEFETSLM